MHHAGAGDVFEQVLDALAFAERVHDRRHGAHVEGVGADEQEVAGDPVELGQDHAKVLRTLRHFQAHEPLDGPDEDVLVVEVGDVVEAVEQGDDLAVGLVLADLLGASVQVADVRAAADDALAVDRQHHAEHAVGRRVLRPHVQHHVDGVDVRIDGHA